MCHDGLSVYRTFQVVTGLEINSLLLIILVNVKSIEIARLIDITKTDCFVIFCGNDDPVLTKGFFPSCQICFAVCPNVQLLFCIIFFIYTVVRFIKKLRYL